MKEGAEDNDDERVDCLWPGCSCLEDCNPDAAEERIEQENTPRKEGAGLAGPNGRPLQVTAEGLVESAEPPQSSYADLVWLKCLAEDDNPLINPRVYRSAIRQAATAIETLSQKLADQHARLLNTNDMFDKELDSLRAENERLRRTLTKIDKKIAIAAAMDNHWKELISDVQMLARAALKGTRIMKTVREVIAERLRADGEINGCPPGTPLHDWFGDANSILSALKEAGYAVVPVEPSSPMQAAGSGALGIEGIKSVTSYGAAGRAYVAMVAASQDQGRE